MSDLGPATGRPGADHVPLRLVLASASPRRAHLLETLGIACTVDPADIEEHARAGEPPVEQAERLAREKAEAVRDRWPELPVLAGDTVVSMDGRPVGKPATTDDAMRMLALLSGRTHLVASGLALALPGGRVLSGAMETRVTFRPLREDEMKAYVETGEPMDKAGGYGIQGLGAALVAGIQGDYSTVVGLPIPLLIRLLAEGGRPYTFPSRGGAGP